MCCSSISPYRFSMHMCLGHPVILPFWCFPRFFQVMGKRIHSVIECTTQTLFSYVSRGLLEVHKLLFVLLLTCKIEIRAGTLSHDAFHCLLKAGATLSLDALPPKPVAWLPARAWLNVLALVQCSKTLRYLTDHMQRAPAAWKSWWDQVCDASSCGSCPLSPFSSDSSTLTKGINSFGGFTTGQSEPLRADAVPSVEVAKSLWPQGRHNL